MKDDGFVDVSLLGAADALAMLLDGRLSAEELTKGCLARIGADEPRVQAWAFLDAERALAQAQAGGPACARKDTRWGRCTAFRWA